MENNSITRRKFLATTAALAATACSLPGLGASVEKPGRRFTFIVFSKAFQDLSPDETADLVAEAGLDGIECPVRAGGQVLPERVEEDLPKMAEALRKRGLALPLITTDIRKAGNELDHRVLKTGGKLGIPFYRLGWSNYASEPGIPEQLVQQTKDLATLADWNKECGVCACLQNHSGANYVGAAVWDAWQVLKDLNPKFFGTAFDIGHATVEGGYAWKIHARLMEPFRRVIYVKDFTWKQNKGKWTAEWCPLGQGMISPEFFKTVQKSTFSGPISLHVEYPAGKGKELLAALKQDAKTLRSWLTD